jgi:hypothetical protein
MRKPILMIMAIWAMISCDCFTQDAAADGINAVRHSRCRAGQRCVVYRPACPDRYSCSSLYGAYGPWGGVAYWSKYSYGALPYNGWGRWW